MCCPGRRAANNNNGANQGGPFGGRGAGGRGGFRCGRGGRGGQCRGPPRFIRALFGGRAGNNNDRYDTMSGREELGEAGYKDFPTSSSEKGGKKAAADQDGSESEDEDLYEKKGDGAGADAVTTKEDPKKHESTPPRYSQVIKN